MDFAPPAVPGAAADDAAAAAALLAGLGDAPPPPPQGAPLAPGDDFFAPAPPAAAAAGAAGPVLPELQALTSPQLQLLQQDPAAYECFFHSLPFVRNVAQVHADVQAEVERQAVENCSAHNELQRLQAEIAALKETATEKRAALRATQQRRRDLAQQLTPELVVAKLDECAAEAEQRSDAISESFLSGGDPGVLPGLGDGDIERRLQQFIQDYTAARKEYHVSRFKCDHAPALAEQTQVAKAERQDLTVYTPRQGPFAG